MDIPNHDELLTGIEDFCRRHAMAETRFGRDAINNPNFIRGLRDGVSPTLDTLTKVRDFMAAVDRDAATRAKLHAAPEVGSGAPEPEELDLPFGAAPVNPTGASSPTSSTIAAPPPPSAASDSSPTSTASRVRAGRTPSRSCSGAEHV